MNRKVIYTCIIGGYDTLMQPLVLDDSFDYVCFVERTSGSMERQGVWQLRPLPVSTSSSQLDSRYPKMHPHLLLPEYDYSLWIDGNILIKDGTIYEAFDVAARSGAIYAGVSHPARDCVYEEARKCRDMRYITYPDLARIWLTYAWHGIPRHAGLLENNIIFREHNNPAIISLDEMWWQRVLHFCRRDQLSLGLCLRKTGIRPAYLLPEGVNSRNCPGLEYRLHGTRGRDKLAGQQD